MQDKPYLTTSELAEILGISRVAVFKKIKAGKIKAKKIGRNFIIFKEDMPEVFGDELTEERKKQIEEAVKKVVEEYGETLELLGKE